MLNFALKALTAITTLATCAGLAVIIGPFYLLGLVLSEIEERRSRDDAVARIAEPA